MGRLGKTCGAVTGTTMVIGLRYGKAIPEDEPAKQKTYELVQEFVRKFEQINGTTECRALIGYDLTTSEGMKGARAAGVFNNICTKYVRDGVKILEEMGF